MRDAEGHAYKYRIAFGAWVNDMRSDPLPLANWPAPNLDAEAVNSVIKALDLQSQSGFTALDVWGLFATSGYPPDIVSAVGKNRRRRVNQILKAAHERGMKLMLGLGLYTWGYDRIIEHDPTVRGTDLSGRPSAHAMCGAKEESWSYVSKIIDFALSEFDFGGVHLESADQGWCHCPECAGRYGVVAYNVRLNIRAADYIKSKWPDKVVTSIPINWLAAERGRQHFNDEEKARIVELSRHIDCFMDQGWRGTYIAEAERRDFIGQLRCDYGTSGGLWPYPSVRWDRAAYFLPHAYRAALAIKAHYEEGARGCMFYQGPVSNPGTEVTIAVGGRILSDTRRDVEDVLHEVVERLYQPKSAPVHSQLVAIFRRAEDAYFGQWSDERFAKLHGTPPPGEFKLDELWGTSPGPATFLSNLYLDAQGRLAYKQGLVAILQDLPGLQPGCRDGGRLEKIRKAIMYTLTLINTISYCQGEQQVWRDW